jgi:hypothetical protein
MKGMDGMLKNISNRILLYILGSFILVAGIFLILLWWKDVVALFRGTLGMVLALAGLLALYSLKAK